jgi:hypothetical protein
MARILAAVSHAELQADKEALAAWANGDLSVVEKHFASVMGFLNSAFDSSTFINTNYNHLQQYAKALNNNTNNNNTNNISSQPIVNTFDFLNNSQNNNNINLNIINNVVTTTNPNTTININNNNHNNANNTINNNRKNANNNNNTFVDSSLILENPSVWKFKN